MRSSVVLLGFAAIAAAVAVPAPQNFDFSIYKALDDMKIESPPVGGGQQAPKAVDVADVLDDAKDAGIAAAKSASKSTKASRSVEARAACDPQSAGSAPSTTPDTAQAFSNNQVYVQMGGNAQTPQGYSLTFQNLHGATQQGGYLGFYTLTSYNTIACQQYCDAATNCVAFNIYIERDPSVTPGPGCPNPPATFNYKCSLWSLGLSSSSATNTGQFQADFEVAITASNGYTKYPPPPSYANYTGPMALGGAIQTNDGSYITMNLFPGSFDPSQCAAACQSITAYDKANLVTDGTYKACNFFNAYVISKNNVPQGTQCSYYTRPYDKSYSTNYGQYDSAGNYYSVSQSYSYTLTTQDSGRV